MTDDCTGITASAHSEVGRRFLAGLAVDIRAAQQREADWHDALRARGVVLAHPDDGWVDRRENTIHFAYPTLRDAKPAAGALVALGTPERWRLVRLMRFEAWTVALDPERDGRWAFEVVPHA